VSQEKFETLTDVTHLLITKYILKLAGIRNNKASGWDGIPVEFWKVLCNGEQGVEILTDMFNRKQFPIEWKTTIIHPIYKGRGVWVKPGNCRGISLLSACSKIFSGI
jgi:hypothetical protein